MQELASPARLVQFGPFTLDLRSSELRSGSTRLKVPSQSIEILTALLEQPGELVTRDQLRARLWPSDTFVDFEHGLNAAIRRLREALGDSADRPTYIETLPKRGYRFVGAVEAVTDRVPASDDACVRHRGRSAAAIGSLVVSLIFVGAWLSSRWLRETPDLGASPRIRSIAVLPLKNLSGDPQQSFFVEGMQEALMTELSRIRALRVVSRTSTSSYQGSTQSLPEIARALRVDALIEGSVQRADNQVRITVNLIDGGTDQRLWGDSYDRPLDGILRLHTEVARAVVEQIRVAVTPGEARELTRSRRVNPEAYLEYLQGNYDLAKQIVPAYKQAQAHFEKSIELDQEYAPAHAGLAQVLTAFGGWNSPLAPGVVHASAKAAAERALHLDPFLADGHIAMGRLKAWFEWDWPAAEAAFSRGMALGPNSSMGRLSYANYLTMTGRYDESIRIGTQTTEIYPLLPSAHQELAFAYFAAGRPSEALGHFDKALGLNPNMLASHVLRALLYVRKGASSEATADIESLRSLLGDAGPPHRLGELGYLYGKTDRTAEALHLIEVLRRRGQTGYIPAAAIGDIYLGLNRYDEAMVEYERAFGQHDVWLIWLKAHPMYDEIRGDPRFQSLIKRMKFPD